MVGPRRESRFVPAGALDLAGELSRKTDCNQSRGSGGCIMNWFRNLAVLSVIGMLTLAPAAKAQGLSCPSVPTPSKCNACGCGNGSNDGNKPGSNGGGDNG